MRTALCISVVLGALGAARANADIRQVRFLPAETMDLTAVGTIDWCVYRVTDAPKPTFAAADFMKGGEGVGRKIAVRGTIHIPTRQERAARQAAELRKIDYLKLATDFADCMLEHGRDHYGREHTPLFAVLLLREDPPRIGPQPVFASPARYDWQKKMENPFRRFDYNRCLNYPAGLGDEGPHKVTLYGCDVYEDADLYTMLIDLTRITGAATYKAEAERALTWWFTHTIGPADLYPWGEHLGWDFENECPTYFEGPSKHLYAACYHEIKDTVPFLDHLAALPAAGDEERTPLERYALGVWKAHYWDPDRAIYCRHGDYTGKDDRTGGLAGFPAHQGAHLRLWVKAYLTTKDDLLKQRFADILTKVLDVQTARAKTYGFIPFTFDPDVKGKKAKRSGQSDRLAHHAAELSVITKQDAPDLSAKLHELAKVLLGEQGFADAVGKVERFRATGDRGYLRGAYDSRTKPAARVADLSKAETPAEHAREIVRRLRWYRQHEDEAYLRAAEQQARIAYVQFCDETCPLPKAYAGEPRRSVDGKPFPDFYFRGAKLMHAFALFGEAMRE